MNDDSETPRPFALPTDIRHRIQWRRSNSHYILECAQAFDQAAKLKPTPQIGLPLKGWALIAQDYVERKRHVTREPYAYYALHRLLRARHIDGGNPYRGDRDHRDACQSAVAECLRIADAVQQHDIAIPYPALDAVDAADQAIDALNTTGNYFDRVKFPHDERDPECAPTLPFGLRLPLRRIASHPSETDALEQQTAPQRPASKAARAVAKLERETALSIQLKWQAGSPRPAVVTPLAIEWLFEAFDDLREANRRDVKRGYIETEWDSQIFGVILYRLDELLPNSDGPNRFESPVIDPINQPAHYDLWNLLKPGILVTTRTFNELAKFKDARRDFPISPKERDAYRILTAAMKDPIPATEVIPEARPAAPSSNGLTVQEAAKLLGCSDGQVTKLCNDGTLKSTGQHRAREIDLPSVRAYKQRRRKPPEENDEKIERDLARAEKHHTR